VQAQFQTTPPRGSSGALVKRKISARAGAARKARAGQLLSRVVAREERSRGGNAGDEQVVDGRAAMVIGVGMDGGGLTKAVDNNEWKFLRFLIGRSSCSRDQSPFLVPRELRPFR